MDDRHEVPRAAGALSSRVPSLLAAFLQDLGNVPIDGRTVFLAHDAGLEKSAVLVLHALERRTDSLRRYSQPRLAGVRKVAPQQAVGFIDELFHLTWGRRRERHGGFQAFDQFNGRRHDLRVIAPIGNIDAGRHSRHGNPQISCLGSQPAELAPIFQWIGWHRNRLRTCRSGEKASESRHGQSRTACADKLPAIQMARWYRLFPHELVSFKSLPRKDRGRRPLWRRTSPKHVMLRTVHDGNSLMVYPVLYV